MSFQNEKLEELLDIDPCQTVEELSAALCVNRFTVGKCRHALGIVQKAGNWIPHELKAGDIERRLVSCEMLLQRQGKESFLYRIITDDEVCIHCDNSKRKLAWVKSAEVGPSTPKLNIHRLKVMLCIWRDIQGVVY
ncbi:hypothetical protein Trydic_g19746 [Trypoxylus dichotomus]